MFHVVEWNELIRRRENEGYSKIRNVNRVTSVTLEVVILFVSLDYTSHDTIHKFARTHVFKMFFCIYNVLIKSFESCHERKIIRETVLKNKPLCTHEEFRFEALNVKS